MRACSRRAGPNANGTHRRHRPSAFPAACSPVARCVWGHRTSCQRQRHRHCFRHCFRVCCRCEPEGDTAPRVTCQVSLVTALYKSTTRHRATHSEIESLPIVCVYMYVCACVCVCVCMCVRVYVCAWHVIYFSLSLFASLHFYAHEKRRRAFPAPDGDV